MHANYYNVCPQCSFTASILPSTQQRQIIYHFVLINILTKQILTQICSM